MSHRIAFGLDDDNYALARAYASDRGLKLCDAARAAFLSDVKRHAGRSGLRAEIERLVDLRLKASPSGLPHVGAGQA